MTKEERAFKRDIFRHLYIAAGHGQELCKLFVRDSGARTIIDLGLEGDKQHEAEVVVAYPDGGLFQTIRFSSKNTSEEYHASLTRLCQVIFKRREFLQNTEEFKT